MNRIQRLSRDIIDPSAPLPDADPVPADAPIRPRAAASRPATDEAAACPDNTDRRAIERGENEGMIDRAA